MTDRLISVLCYVNGTIVHNSEGVSYDREPVRIIRVVHGISFEEFEGMIQKALQISSGERLRLTYRYPLQFGGGYMKFRTFSITSEEDLQHIFSLLNDFPPPNNMEIYVDVIGRRESGARARCLSENEDVNVASAHSPLENVGPSKMSPVEHMNVGERLMEIDNYPSASRLGNDYLTSDDDTGRSSDDVGEDGDNDETEEPLNHIHFRDPLMRMIENDGSTYPPPMSEAYNYGLSMEDDESHDTSLHYPRSTLPHDTIGYEAPSPSFMELNEEARTPMSDDHDNVAMGWSESHDLCKGLTFPSKEDLQYSVKRCCIAQQREYIVVDSEPTVWSVKCKKWKDGCLWRVRAAKRKRTRMFEITKCHGTHTCVFPRMSQEHRQLGSLLIFRDVFPIVKRDPLVSIGALHELIKDKYKYDVLYRRVWRAKTKVIEKIFGDWDESYNVLPWWIDVLNATNIGIIAGLQHYEEHPENVGEAVFRRCFWAFGASIEGFKHCRPIIQIDGTHLYGKYRGKMLIATGIDASSHIFPLACAIVEEENKDNWSWFLRILRYQVTDRPNICLISDHHAGILAAIQDPNNGWMEPFAHHRYCLRHVGSNFNDKFRDNELRDLAKKVGSQHQPRKFASIMALLEHKREGCTRWFRAMDPKLWTMAFDGGVRYGWMTSNVAESFNGVLKGARMFPITTLAQLTFYRTVAWFQDRRAEIEKTLSEGQIYTDYAIERMRKWTSKAGSHTVTLIGRQLQRFEVVTGVQNARLHKGGNKQVVNLREKFCSCGKWQCYGIPCSHVQAVCRFAALDCDVYIEEWYRLDKYIKCYEPHFHPIPYDAYWPAPTLRCKIIPNIACVRKKGRPRTSRITNEMDIREPSSRIRCGHCGREGHNRHSCPIRQSHAT